MTSDMAVPFVAVATDFTNGGLAELDSGELRSAVLAQRHDLALAYVERYKAAYPGEYAEWAKLNEKK